MWHLKLFSSFEIMLYWRTGENAMKIPSHQTIKCGWYDCDKDFFIVSFIHPTTCLQSNVWKTGPERFKILCFPTGHIHTNQSIGFSISSGQRIVARRLLCICPKGWREPGSSKHQLASPPEHITQGYRGWSVWCLEIYHCCMVCLVDLRWTVIAKSLIGLSKLNGMSQSSCQTTRHHVPEYGFLHRLFPRNVYEFPWKGGGLLWRAYERHSVV